MSCWYCNGKLIWQSDFAYEDIFGEGEGIVTLLACSECGVNIQYSLKEED